MSRSRQMFSIPRLVTLTAFVFDRTPCGRPHTRRFTSPLRGVSCQLSMTFGKWSGRRTHRSLSWQPGRLRKDGSVLKKKNLTVHHDIYHVYINLSGIPPPFCVHVIDLFSCRINVCRTGQKIEVLRRWVHTWSPPRQRDKLPITKSEFWNCFQWNGWGNGVRSRPAFPDVCLQEF